MRQIITTLVISLALFLSACTISLAEDIAPPPGAQLQPASTSETAQISGPTYPLVPPNPENGASIYAEKCAPCHGDTGAGDGPQAAQLPNPTTPIGARNIANQSTPGDWYTAVTNGNLDRFMPPFPSLSDRQRWDVIAYVYSLSTTEEEIALGEEIYQANCTDCHGLAGEGNGPRAANLSSPPADFTNQAFMAQRSIDSFFQAVSDGAAAEVHAFGDILDEQQRWAVAGYLRTLAFTWPGRPIQAASPTSDVAGTVDTEAGDVAEGAGTVTGQVMNGSGGELSADLEVNLHVFDGMQVVYTDATALQEDGSFIFTSVEMAPGRRFLVSVEQGQATYVSNLATASEATSNLSLDVTVYDTSTDVSQLSVERLHVIFEFSQPDIIQVVQLYIISNDTNETIVPFAEGGPVVNFSLPEGAANLQFQDGVLGERYLRTPTGFADTVAVRPGTGEYQVLFAYELPFIRRLNLEQPLDLPVEAVVVLLPEDGVRVNSEMLEDEGIHPVQGENYRLYRGENLEAGSSLVLTLSGRPGSGISLFSDSNTSLIVGLGSFGLVMIIAGVWLYFRNQGMGKETEDELEAAEEEYTYEDSESLMDAILALDDLYSEGKLPEDAYRKRRAELKSRLKEISG